MNQIKLFATVLMVLISYSINAQIQSMTKDASIVVEGIVLSKNAFWNQEKTRIYTDNKVLVKSVFKGVPSDSILSVVTIGGEVDDYFQFQTHAIELQSNQRGYFFLKDGLENRFRLVNDSYGFCSQNRDLNPKVYIQGRIYSKTKFEEEIIKETRFPKISLEENFLINNAQTFEERDSCEILSFIESEKTIEFSFDNVQYTENFTHIEFDVMAKVNTPGLKFGKGNLFIKYSEEFGSTVVSEETAEILKGDILQNNLYSIDYQDASSQTISVVADSDYGSNNLYTFSASPESILHIKLKIEDFTQIGSLSFDDIDITGQVYFWCRGGYQLFDEVILDGPITSTEPQDGSEIGITYTFENVNTNFNDTELTVDLFAEATAESKYSDAFIYINYNELGFGQNVFTNGTFTFTQDDLIENTSVYSVFISDNDFNTLQIVIFSGSDPNPNDLGVLSTAPRKLGTLKFTIVDCDEDKGLSFDPITTSSDHTHYTGNMPIPYELYDPIIADDEETGKICGCSTPEITGFTPDNIPAGNGDILTITGQNFGVHSPAESNVWFKNGDDGSDTWMRAHPVRDFLWDNIIHWTDTEIQVRVPSVDAEQSIRKPAASGKFKVENACGEDESDEILTIPYAVMNRRSSGKARKIILKELNDGGICFTYKGDNNPSTNNDLPSWIRTEFENALNAWCPHTNISFFISEVDENLNGTAPNDNINIFIEEAVSTENGAAALLFTGRTELCQGGQEEGYFMTDMDIIIDPSWTGMAFPEPEDKINMRNRLKHELGHAHMINHAVIPGVFQPYNQSIVYWSFTATSSGGINVTIKPDDVTGANQVFPNSQQILSASCGVPIQASSQCGESCSGTNSVWDNEIDKNVIVFPNPTDGKIFVQSLDVDFESEGFFEIVDETGRVHFSKTISVNTKTIEIDINLASGIYFLKYQSEDGLFTKKIIVL